MDLESLKTKSSEFFNGGEEVVSVKQYFAIIGVLMIVIVLGLNFIINQKSESSETTDEKSALSEFPSATPKQEVAGETAGPNAVAGPANKDIASPTKAPKKSPTPTSASQATESPTKTPTPTSAPSTDTPTPTPTDMPTPTPTPDVTDTPTPPPTDTPTPEP